MLLNSKELSKLLKELTILYVEDDKITRDNIADTLKIFCNNIITASNGLEALEIFNKNKIHILITDIEMPIKNGISLVEDIRKNDIKIPIIMLTAYTSNEYLLPCVNLNIQSYIQKPINYTKLKESFFKVITYLNLTSNIYIHINNEISYDKINGTIVKNKDKIKLNKKEKELMDLLIENKNQLISYKQIEQNIWENNNKSMSSSALRTLIKNLRKKIGNEYIENISGLGYKLYTLNNTSQF